MIWFLRILFIFLTVLGISAITKSNSEIVRSTTTSAKYEPATKLLLQNYIPRLIRLPLPREDIAVKYLGEDLHLIVEEVIPNEKISWRLEGFQNYLHLREEYKFQTVENNVQVEARAELIPKPGFVSRFILLFFGDSTLSGLLDKSLNSLPKP
ncbi:hypothetical protein [Leptospira ilyithenensis]|uniref:SRPBCC family protein n=1 Tax=Leptospira ilyithenensis TaxID=2484901 RepID=A0A4R9LLD2_9LEPT|nr:hypothetical protein [Leptospira ilyithenensis]TGN06567.1 hypothetical protein EHS11_19655 [Leptospira ilyithenensis]